MRFHLRVFISAVLFALAVSLACSSFALEWNAVEIKTLSGFSVPESVLCDPADDCLFVSNIYAPEGAYWADDGKGFITRLTRDGNLDDMYWLNTAKEKPVHSPKGMCVLAGMLYFTDNAKLRRAPVNDPKALETIALPGTEMLNDIATDGVSVFVSDTATGTIHKVSPAGGSVPLKGPASANGLACWKGKLYAVSWDLHDLYEVDLEGVKEARAFGLASHFTALDGIEILDDGTFVVSDFKGNKICTVPADEKTVAVLAGIESPADIGLDRQRSVLLVPQFDSGKVVLFNLTPKE